MAAAATRRLLRWLSVRLESFARSLPQRLLSRRLTRAAPRGPSPLQALTAAALVLPGLAASVGRADEGDEFAFQYGHYEQSEFNLFGVKSAFDPLRVDSFSTSGKLTLADRVRFGIDYAEDTWSGATPIATAPQVFDGNRPTSPDGISGATPFIEGDLFLDSHKRPVGQNSLGEFTKPNTRNVHTLSSASPEARKQLDGSLGYEWDELELHFGGGASLEDDYRARFGSLGGTWDLDQKRTSLAFGLSYTAVAVDALLDHDAVPYIDTSAFASDIDVSPGTGNRTLHADREDWASQLTLTQVLTKNAFVEAFVGFTRSRGYLENPYKVVEVGFIDPEQQFLAPPGGFYAQVHALLEQRPNVRDQWTFGLRWVQYLEGLGASLHLGYRFFHDDWGIDAHTFEGSWAQPLGAGWTLTPRVRFYSQDAANFYHDYLLSPQAFQTVVSDPDTGDIISITPFDRRLLPSQFSSDQRLSAYGALSAGVNLSKTLSDGIHLVADFEYYDHAGKLKLGGGGEDSFSDFHAYLISAGLTLDSSALTAFGRSGAGEHAEHEGHSGAGAPAGVMLAHMLTRAGDFMVAYESMWSSQRGDMLSGTQRASDAQILANGCEGEPCLTAPRSMQMNMHMLELMYAPTSWLNVMLMPTFVDMQMDLRPLVGATLDSHGAHEHQSGGVGDVGIYALFSLLDREGQHLHAGLGLSAPAGAVDVKDRRTHQEEEVFTHYGMQLGSGTWDLLPSVTYTGQRGAFSWGGQLSGVKRLERANSSGYALGDVFQATAWGSYSLARWLSFSTRGIYTMQRRIVGAYDGLHAESGPMDFPANYGGQYWDLGVGLSAALPFRDLDGNRVGVEWLQPLQDDVNGDQLERRGTLVLRWSVEF